jgi:hypothetical protein
MKKAVIALLLLAVLVVGGFTAYAKIDGNETPSAISDEIAYRQLFLLLSTDKNPQSAQAVQGYCDYVLKLTQPEKEDLLKLVDAFNALEADAGEKHKKAEKEGDIKKIKEFRQVRKNLGKNVIAALPFEAKEKVDKQLERIKKNTTLDSPDDEF